MKGEIIVIEGLDGSGKATQAELLYQAFLEQGRSTRKVSFPDYDSPSSALVKMYLAGEFGDKPSDVNAYAASSFYAVDRYASYEKDWGQFYQTGGVIIADRYTTSNAIHQCSKLPEEQWDGFLDWLFRYEYELLEIPQPDVVLFLKTDVGVSQQLLAKRYHGDASKKDIHEKDVQYLLRSQKAALYCAEKLGWKVVECMADGKMKSVNEICGCILKAVTAL